MSYHNSLQARLLGKPLDEAFMSLDRTSRSLGCPTITQLMLRQANRCGMDLHSYLHMLASFTVCQESSITSLCAHAEWLGLGCMVVVAADSMAVVWWQRHLQLLPPHTLVVCATAATREHYSTLEFLYVFMSMLASNRLGNIMDNDWRSDSVAAAARRARLFLDLPSLSSGMVV
ncbi:hypothetical protein BC831DRAFT_480305 [Entophlyctis helioformis]|nr:hypothetical protein BC831DRAFT_480305 [Entophlyctis helioformis]